MATLFSSQGGYFMQMKENFVRTVILNLSESFEFDPSTLSQIQNILYSTLDDYFLDTKKDLPAYCDNDVKIIKHFLLAKKMSGCSNETLKTYYTHLRAFFRFANVSIESVEAYHVFSYIAEKTKTCSFSYLNDIREILFVFFTFCTKEEYIQKNPCLKIDRIKYIRNPEQTFSDMDIVQIREACVSPRETAMVDLFISTGIRRDELRSIKLSDVNLRDRSIIIHGKGSKTRIVYFSARCEYSLTAYLATGNRSDIYLFSKLHKPHTQLSKDAVGYIIRNIGLRANVENVHPHRFRNYFATYMINKGVDIQDLKEMMGHSRIDTTSLYYVRANLERVKYKHLNNAI